MTFEQLQEANGLIKTTPIKGKDYAEVPQRIKAFRKLYPDGFIRTDMMDLTAGVCIIRATAGYYAEDGTERVLGTGTAYEVEGSNFINTTSYIENCETSAVGRALGMIGIGSDTSVASFEEVANAKAQQESGGRIKPTEAEALGKILNATQRKAWLEHFGKSDLKNLTAKEYAEINEWIRKAQEKKNGKQGEA